MSSLRLREQITENSLELFGDFVLFSDDGLTRLEYFQEFEDLYAKSNFFDFDYGKVYNLSEMTEFLITLTQAARGIDQSPFLTNDDFEGKMNKIPKAIPLYKFTPDDWKKLRLRLTKIQASMLRCDADASVNNIIANRDDKHSAETRQIDRFRSEDPWFTEKLSGVLMLFTFHEQFAPFRNVLERKCVARNEGKCDDDDANDVEKHSKHLSVSKEFLAEYLHTISDQENDKLKSAFRHFLKEDEMHSSFRSPSTIHALLNDPTKPMSFSFLLNRVTKLFRSWAIKVFERPKLGQVYPLIRDGKAAETGAASSISESDRNRALRRLQKSRSRLDDQVQDPLPGVIAAATRVRKRSKRSEDNEDEDEDEDREISSEAVTKDKLQNKRKSSPTKSKRARKSRSPTAHGKLLEKKKSAISLEFTQEEEEMSEPEDSDEDVLPQMEKHASAVTSPSSAQKRKKSQEKMYEGRRMWIDIEKNCIKEGIQNHGLGKWALIKNENSTILRHRTSGQIKDCFRTMKKRGELDGMKEAWPENEDSEEKESAEKPAEEDKDGENDDNDNDNE